MDRKPIFDQVRSTLGRAFSQPEVDALDAAIDAAIEEGTPSPRALGPAGTALIKTWEGCEKRLKDGTFEAYPDPGSADGRPWTIGWGSTGPDIRPGLIWTQAQCDARFERDIAAYVREVAEFLSASPTSANQFDALVSFHYNTGAIRRSTLGALHKAGRFAEARAEFGRWIHNNGKPMKGLQNRRREEAELYGTA
ncbi:lysozyme [Novosphingobium panipatense]|uniref:Lysozyme n=1 Tax=Novosphingobium panipatense TaxID=428991 RepID=A0ABY1Q6F2_9SPHN|nr:lysozyme [Novosphingobium panipatense]SMP61225.1 Phage-related lysozyme (muramidase), GH24 family [Novosphingobium panipatense]